MLAISDNYAIVGTPQEDDASGDKSGKAYVFDLSDGSLAYTLDNPNPVGTSTEDYFGMAVDLDDDFVIVGAPYEDDAVSNLYPGKAYIYNLTDGSLVRTLDDPNAFGTTDGDRFGHSVAINDGIAIVSASLEDDAGGTDSGKVYIFDAQVAAPAVSADWSNVTLSHTLDNPSPFGSSGGDAFGSAVAISGNYAIVGADREDDAGGGDSGKAYIYNASTGALLYTLDNPNPYGGSPFDYFGASVAISDDHAIVGAYSEDDGGTDSGKAYIYDLSDGSLLYTLDNPNPYGSSAEDYFGRHVGISGDRAIVGAILEGNKAGKAYIYNVSTGALVHTLHNPLPTANNSTAGDQFGTVAISGDYAIVGAYNADDAGGTFSGKAYIYNVSTGALVHTINNPNAYGTSGGDRFGITVAISGDHAIVGSYEGDANGSNSGKAYIFDVATGALVHTLDNPNPYGTSEYDRFAYSVSISGDHAIVGALLEDEADGVTNSGKVYIYNVTSGALVKTLDNPNAYGTGVDDVFGIAVAISGGRTIVGANSEDDAGDGNKSGKAYIFSAPEAAPVSSGWTADMSLVSYDNITLSVVSQGNYPTGMKFNDNGTKMYMLDSSGVIYEYDLSTAFDLSTSTYNNVSFDSSAQESSTYGFDFNDDGTKLYIVGFSDGKVYQYGLSTAYDLSTIAYSNVFFGISSQASLASDITFNIDGTKMYVVGYGTKDIFQYTLSTGFDVSTASYNSISINVDSVEQSPFSIEFNPDGTKMYMVGNNLDTVQQFSLTSAFDISTATYDNVSFGVSNEEGGPVDVIFSTDGSKMYIAGANGELHQYSTGL